MSRDVVLLGLPRQSPKVPSTDEIQATLPCLVHGPGHCAAAGGEDGRPLSQQVQSKQIHARHIPSHHPRRPPLVVVWHARVAWPGLVCFLFAAGSWQARPPPPPSGFTPFSSLLNLAVFGACLIVSGWRSFSCSAPRPCPRPCLICLHTPVLRASARVPSCHVPDHTVSTPTAYFSTAYRFVPTMRSPWAAIDTHTVGALVVLGV